MFFGGPVAVPGVLALVRAKSAPADTRRVAPDVYLVDTREVLEKMIAREPSRTDCACTSATPGWGEGSTGTRKRRAEHGTSWRATATS